MNNNFPVSFEVYPPKIWDEAEEVKYNKLIGELMKYNPVSISCTFSANGGSKDTTLNVLKIIKSYNVKTISHFACANRSIEDVKNYFDELVNLNINNVLILQGDKPTATDPFKYASDLMHYINNKYNGFFIFQGAFYPEKHNENKTCDYDIEIKRTILNKYNAGCRTFISQSIFDVDIYFDSISQIKKQFNDITLLPGILPITRHAMVERAITLCGCTIKQEWYDELQALKDNPDDFFKKGCYIAAKIISELITNNYTKQIHIFTMNSYKTIDEIFNILHSWNINI